ncbi:MAG: metalloregulator ArsR/SmtB family transcription factor [Longicatena sp.]|jgi:ArsR family transcriptional regulator, lead/cadmium/zinc/bismuth-responsive transcriptional repressor|uniref:ArsR/SmtB family transcription factor n=1 Tax=Anaerorhabdus sp. TaxID=1872524 RepID=UPI002FC9EAF6
MKNFELDSQYEEMSLLFKMFSDSTRLKILHLLFEQERCVSDFVENLEMSQSAVSHQLASLKKTHLIKSRKSGKNVYYSLADEHIVSIFKMAYEHVNE